MGRCPVARAQPMADFPFQVAPSAAAIAPTFARAASVEPIAGDGVADRQREEDERDGEHDDVQHLLAPSGACVPRTANAFGGAAMRCA